jgi:hypothetical protein
MSNLSPASILYDSAGVEKGTGANPVRTDPTGTTTQPVSAASLPLPVGAATEATALTLLTQADFAARTGAVTASPAANTVLARLKDIVDTLVARLGTLGQKAMGASTPVVIASDQTPVLVRGFDEPTFVVVAAGVVIGNGKSMLSLFSTGTNPIRLRELWLINAQTIAVTGVVGEFQIRRMTAHSAGTDLTTSLRTHDTTDTIPATLTARTGATLVGEDTVSLFRRLISTDEYGTGSLDVEASDHAQANHRPVYRAATPAKPITIRNGQGISVRFNTNSTAGAFDVVAVLTEAVP